MPQLPLKTDFEAHQNAKLLPFACARLLPPRLSSSRFRLGSSYIGLRGSFFDGSKVGSLSFVLSYGRWGECLGSPRELPLALVGSCLASVTERTLAAGDPK